MKQKLQKKSKEILFQVLLYNSSNDLPRLLKSINSLSVPFEKVRFVFMDQSEDESEYDKARKTINEFNIKNKKISMLLDKQPNYGFGKGHNEVNRKHSKVFNDFFIILNPDTILPFDLLEQISAYLMLLENENWGLLELQQFPNEHPKYYDPKTLETKWASGAGLIIKKDAFEHIGQFDENIFMYGEDVDLSIRMQINNYKVMHLPKAKFIHFTKDTDVSEQSEFTRVHKLSSDLYLRFKYGNKKSVTEFLERIGKDDENYSLIIKNYEEMKKNLPQKIPYKKFLDKNNEYSKFRWTIL